jgi:V/A-type H+-transporting ATPase subunit A
MSEPRLVRVVGSLAEVSPMPGAALYELVRVGERRLLGEVIRVVGDLATVDVFEETAGLAVGEPVETTGGPLAVALGPGLLGSVLDGVGRRLDVLGARDGDLLAPGAEAPTLDPERRWSFEPACRPGQAVEAGDVLGVVEERPGIEHRVMLAPGRAGVVASIAAGEYRAAESFGALEEGGALTLAQHWPVRWPRPVQARLPADRPFVTGQRVFDLLFPVAEGGTVALPGGFGTGKTVIEQALARFADADIIVYVGCGERGNEMADVLTEFPELVDPRTGRSIMDRSVLVVNTSNMPVAAREASVYLGITVAEYYRDMGYRVALMADSISRWAEALREIGSRLREMPGEEGYPTYLSHRLGQLYERAGRVRCAGSPEREGALTLVSAVSPPGGDFSEPVTQASLRVVSALWALDPALAHQRQFPAVDWSGSYSLHVESTAEGFGALGGPGWSALRHEVLAVLQRERELDEIAGLVGRGALDDGDQLLLEVARMVRELVIGQNAFDPNDAASPVPKTHALASLVTRLRTLGDRALAAGEPLEGLDLEAARRAIVAVRDAEPAGFAARAEEAAARIDSLMGAGADGEPEADRS